MQVAAALSTPAPTTASSRCAARLAAQPAVRLVHAAASRQQQKSRQQQQGGGGSGGGGSGGDFEDFPNSLPRVQAPADVPTEDFWEGDKFNVLGDVASLMIPLLVVAAIGVGFFASQTYNEGATVFLDAPKSQEDTVRLIPAEQLQAPGP
ncbi:hypothetical protein C2E20_8153 [Micractinium conductrix]|uniref:Uncharacterized protein n=1 Tax=Micractinium conductrix TaxID=554055 RepID=A0A2P6V2F9_9CHLO|nr:hypothetical protein C2E20_8153 [Micractinium conductrix]|eukprot:PSC68234.1 hypothetical protein C2E20_8153 [Micractinium conductrix]